MEDKKGCETVEYCRQLHEAVTCRKRNALEKTLMAQVYNFMHMNVFKKRNIL
jgi:hypothetical protein